MSRKPHTLIAYAVCAVALLLVLIRVQDSRDNIHTKGLRFCSVKFRSTVQDEVVGATTNLTRRYEQCDWNTAGDFDEHDPSDCSAKVRYGTLILCMLKGQPAPTGWVTQSKYTKDSDLVTYGWNLKRETPQARGIGIDDALNALGVSSSNNDWIKMEQEHTGNRAWEATYASYFNSYESKSGTIVAEFNFGPDWCYKHYELDSKFDRDEIVPMKQWSDVVFQGIKQQTKNPKPKIEHIIQHNVIDDRVLKVLKMVIQSDSLSKTQRRWPGYQYGISDPKARAVLYTANAKGAAWILGSHKNELGLKTIDQVNIFECSKSSIESETWCLYFHVVDVE